MASLSSSSSISSASAARSGVGWVAARDSEVPPSSEVATHVLIVGGDRTEITRVQSMLTSPRFACDVASSVESALGAMAIRAFEIVIVSIKKATDSDSGATADAADADHLMMSGALDLIDGARHQSTEVAVILIGDEANIPTIIEAGKHSAHDYIVRSHRYDEMALALRTSIARAIASSNGVGSSQQTGAHQQSEDQEQPHHRSSLLSRSTEPAIIGTSTSLASTLDAVERVAHSAAPVLLVGETGTGKGLLAARIHARGPRRHRPFVIVNAGAIAATLLDSELFGHVAGSFTGATRPRRGLVAEADGGTLFLDEITDLPIELQGRLLRVLESNAIRSVGADRERHVDVRFVVATQRDLSIAVREHRFREDLYFRLNVLAIHVPTLRDRREDLPALITYFFDNARARNPRSPVQQIASPAYKRLLEWTWPGNVRELQGFIERLVVLGKSATIELADVALLGSHIISVQSPIKQPLFQPCVDEPVDRQQTASSPLSSSPPLLGSLHDMTTRHVEAVLESTGGDKARAAAVLGIDVSTLYRWRRRR